MDFFPPVKAVDPSVDYPTFYPVYKSPVYLVEAGGRVAPW